MNKCKMLKSILGIVSLLTIASCGSSGDSVVPDASTSGTSETSAVQEAAVSKISIKTMPTKTEYYVGEEFSVEGGVITVEYEDGTTKDLSMTADGVTVTAPNTSRVGEKTVTVKYGNKKATFKVTVVMKGYDVTFDYNYEGAEDTVVNVMQDEKVDEPTTPTRTGYTFYDWYIDENCTITYDFDTVITADLTLYAQWKEDGVTYYDVTYCMNYYGSAQSEYPQIVKQGGNAQTLALTPERTDYSFSGWYADEACSTKFDNTTAINANTTIYAGWTKTKTGSSTYIFEAEDTYLLDKAGPGYSGENAGLGMIVSSDKLGASGGQFVAYQCKNGNSLEFYLASDEEITNVTLTVRFAAEYASMTLTPDNYQIAVNDVALDYDDIVLTLPDGEQQSQFADFDISGVTLKKDANLVQLKTANNDALGGTLTATAPIIDCIKITTSAVVTWDGTKGLPTNAS